MTSGTKWREQNVDVSHFHTNQDIHKLISETETTVTMELEGGDRQKAMKKLRVPPLGEQKSPWITFKVGLFSGSFIVLFIAVVLTGTGKYSWEDSYFVDKQKWRHVASLYSNIPRRSGESESGLSTLPGSNASH